MRVYLSLFAVFAFSTGLILSKSIDDDDAGLSNALIRREGC
jgi:hypothetical protein